MQTLAFLTLWGHELAPQKEEEEKNHALESKGCQEAYQESDHAEKKETMESCGKQHVGKRQKRRGGSKSRKRCRKKEQKGEEEMKIIKGDSRSKELKKKQSMTRTVTPQASGRGSGPGKKAEKPLKPPMTRVKKKRAF